MLPSADSALHGKPCSRNYLACSPGRLSEQHVPITASIFLHLGGIEKALDVCAIGVGINLGEMTNKVGLLCGITNTRGVYFGVMTPSKGRLVPNLRQ